jgi:hypothetical protein
VPRAADGPAEVEVVRPTGEVLRLPAPERPGEPYRYTETHEPGIYLARSADPRRPKEWAFAVNVDPEEADPVLLPADELQRQFGKHPPIVCESPEEAAAALRKLREGKSLWEVFLALVLAALLLEAYLANRRGTTAVVPSPTPGARPQVARATV